MREAILLSKPELPEERPSSGTVLTEKDVKLAAAQAAQEAAAKAQKVADDYKKSADEAAAADKPPDQCERSVLKTLTDDVIKLLKGINSPPDQP